MYFSKFPVVRYPIKSDTTFRFVLARNILRRVVLSDSLKSTDSAFIQYDVKDGERPEHIAEKLYGDPQYHWLVLLTNETIDPYHGWYKSDAIMQDHIQKKYSNYSVYFTDQSNNIFYSGTVGRGATLTQGSLTDTILDYHPQMCRLVVNKSQFVETVPATITGLCGESYNIRIHRVDPSISTVNHFRMSKGSATFGASEQIVLNPLSQRVSDFSRSGQSIGVCAENGLYAISVANSYRATLAVLNTGRIFGWGSELTSPADSKTVMDYPQSITNAKSVNAGYYHAGAILQDDTVVMWGSNYSGESTPPVGLTGVQQLSCAWRNTTALLKDGRGLTAWGGNAYGEMNLPANQETITQIASGGWHKVALRNDGTVVCWGWNSDGQCTVPAGLNNVVQVSAGVIHTCALKSDGTVVCWGGNVNGQLNVPVNLSGVSKIAAGYRHTHALKTDGTVVTWGNMSIPPSGVSGEKYPRPSFTGGAVEVSGVGDHFTARFNDGSIKSFGLNVNGQSANVVTNSVDLFETYLGTYMGIVGEKDNTYVVNNLTNELENNNKTRTIKLLHPRFKSLAVEELEALLRV